MAAAWKFVSKGLFTSVSRVNINFVPNFIGRFTRPKGTKDYPYIISLKKTKTLKEFYMLFFVFKTVENLIAVSEKFSSVLPAAVAEVFNLLLLPPLLFLL